jgi:predicted ATPase
MLSALLGDGIELAPLKQLVIERTEGNPFFIEEMVQALFDEGALVRNGVVKVTRSLSQLRLPATVQGMLAARIDRLSAEQKDLLQMLAVIGRESPLGLISQVAPQVDTQLERMLAELQRASSSMNGRRSPVLSTFSSTRSRRRSPTARCWLSAASCCMNAPA